MAEAAGTYQRKANQRLFGQVLDHYGHSCACCGGTAHLGIDHVNRAELPRQCWGLYGPALHRWLIKNGFPPGFQTLCRRCNASKKNGPCCRLDHRLGRGSFAPGPGKCVDTSRVPSSNFYVLISEVT